jgi:hypothetical protein
MKWLLTTFVFFGAVGVISCCKWGGTSHSIDIKFDCSNSTDTYVNKNLILFYSKLKLKINKIKIVGVQSRNKCSLWKVRTSRREGVDSFKHNNPAPLAPHLRLSRAAPPRSGVVFFQFFFNCFLKKQFS